MRQWFYRSSVFWRAVLSAADATDSNTVNNNAILKVVAPVAIVTLISLIVSVFFYTECNSNVFLILSLLGCALITIAALLHYTEFCSNFTNRTVLFASYAASLCLLFTFAFPPMTVPDEGHHYLSSYLIADIVSGNQDALNNGTIDMRSCDAALLNEWSTNAITRDSYTTIISHFEFFNPDHEANIQMDVDFDLGSENIPAKIGSVAAILFGRFINLGAYPLFYLGRLFNSAAFIMLVMFAYRITPIGKKIILCVALFPMTLHLAASYSYDAGIIGLALLLSALLLRAIFDSETVTPKHQIEIAIVAALLAPCKLIYIPVLALYIFIPSNKFKHPRQKALSAMLIVLIGILSVSLIRLTSISSLASTPSNGALDYRGTEQGIFYSLQDILTNPLATIALFFRSLVTNGDFYLSTLIGGSLGWFQANIIAPWFFIIPYILITLLAAQPDSTDEAVLSIPFRVTCLIVFVASMLGAMLSMYLGWTFNTESVISGVQGRYFLPLLFIGLLSLRTNFIFITKDMFSFSLNCITILNILYLITIMGTVLV